ncbi:ABC transporter ATP-binding protein [Limnofasciculus baicalensis]|uniref:ATP-binding cassette domain-containing protein n=1 Tax=Limnofasciculus baicalensis BBK-W-15 TaxID=2699891 RepID=A0AAE3GV14_9CYAN|nr:ATP-binding cassette domain-containing protein [Limnofasciculus baicalensis]MCP2729097.1 ATP-binding cassette domain-containing protein [Limnofasciculus baicalensis BBK-W-15]
MNFEEVLEPQIQSPQLELKEVSLVTEGKGALKGMPILTGISLAVNRGERICIIGSSGAGKTSLLRLLNRLEEPTGGIIYLDDRDYRKIPVLDLRRAVMLLLQEPKLLGMTVREALDYPLVLQKFSRNAIEQRVEMMRELFHIPNEWLERTELQLSAGQRQLVAIARALVIQPKILLLDEPTSALDAGTGIHVLNVLVDLAENQGMTILMVNHQLDMAQRFCDRVFYLQQGQLLEDTSSIQMDWQYLRERLVDAETQASQEWF